MKQVILKGAGQLTKKFCNNHLDSKKGMFSENIFRNYWERQQKAIQISASWSIKSHTLHQSKEEGLATVGVWGLRLSLPGPRTLQVSPPSSFKVKQAIQASPSRVPHTPDHRDWWRDGDVIQWGPIGIVPSLLFKLLYKRGSFFSLGLGILGKWVQLVATTLHLKGQSLSMRSVDREVPEGWQELGQHLSPWIQPCLKPEVPALLKYICEQISSIFA